MTRKSVKKQELPRLDDLTLGCVSPQQIEQFWPYVKELIDKALLSGIGDLTLEEIHRRLIAKQSQLWVVVRDSEQTEIVAAATTEIHILPKFKILLITACAGKDLRKWERFITELEAFGAREGCKKLRIYGRKGWVKILSGYSQPWIALERTIK
jgi:hypothetical protein